MREIWKFVLKPETEIDMPKKAKLLSVADQYGNVCLWVEVDTIWENEKRSFVFFGTGHTIPIDLDLAFIGTVLLMDDSLVLHVFEKIVDSNIS